MNPTLYKLYDVLLKLRGNVNDLFPVSVPSLVVKIDPCSIHPSL